MTLLRGVRSGCASVLFVATAAVLSISLDAQTLSPPRSPAMVTSEEPTGRMRGVVLDLTSGRPVAFAAVQLESVRGASRPTRQNVFTAGDGSFEFAEVRAGRYILAASKPGHPPVFYRQAGSGSMFSGDALAVSPGQQIDGLRLGLVRGGVIAGRVVDPDGEPVVNAKITLSPGIEPSRDTPMYIPSRWEMFYTNVRGEYRLWGLPPGDYRVAVSVEAAFAQAGYPPIWFPGVGNGSQAQRISVSAGQVQDGINFNLQPTTQIAISGTIAGAEDLKPWQMEVVLRTKERDAPSLVWAGGNIDATGHFKFPKVSPGVYWLRAARKLATGPTDPSEPAWALLQVSVANSDVKDLVLTMQPWLTLAGNVRVETSMSNMDASRLEINLFAPPDSLFGPEVTRIAIKPSGAFVAPKMKPGRYELRLEAKTPGAVVSVKSVAVGGKPVPTDAITLEPGESLSDVVIVADVRPFVP